MTIRPQRYYLILVLHGKLLPRSFLGLIRILLQCLLLTTNGYQQTLTLVLVKIKTSGVPNSI